MLLISDVGRGEPVSLGAALIAGKKVTPDATLLLMQEHREVQECRDRRDHRVPLENRYLEQKVSIFFL